MSEALKRCVVAFSGGRSSGYMLRCLMDTHADFRDRFVVLFCNTGKERNETLDFVHDVETKWCIPIVWLEYTRVAAIEIEPTVYPHKRSQKVIKEQQRLCQSTHWFRIVTYETARRRTDQLTPFDEVLNWATALPNVRTRLCSVQMKIRTMLRYMFSLGIYDWEDYIGIRADESDRAGEILANCPKYRRPLFPLIDLGTTEPDVIAFWRANDFDLRLKSYEGNCDFCFLKTKGKRVRLAKEDPSGLQWWLDRETIASRDTRITGDGKYFRLGQPYSMIRDLAAERDLFDAVEPEIACGCATGGFKMEHEGAEQ